MPAGGGARWDPGAAGGVRRWPPDPVTKCASMLGARKFKVPPGALLGATLGWSVDGRQGVYIWMCRSSRIARRRKVLRSRLFIPRRADEALEVQQIMQMQARGGRALDPKKELVFVMNPMSGRGRGEAIWDAVVRPILSASGSRFRMVATEGPKHATEVARSLDPAATEAIVVLGGDGTVHEVLQGLMGRPDWEVSSKMPLAQVPTGSGNALAGCAGTSTPVEAMLAVLKGRPAALDVASIFQPPRRHFSFLSSYMGLLSNLDVGTDHLRWMGEARFTYGGARELLKGSKHMARVAFVPKGAPGPPPSGAGHGDGGKGGGVLEACGAGAAGPACPHLEGVTSQVDFDHLGGAWQRVSCEKFHLLACVNLRKISMHGGMVTPHQDFGSGSQTLIWNVDPTNRLQAAEIFLGIDQGTHVNHAKVRSEEVAAAIIEPLRTNSTLVVDGEEMPKETLFLEVHPGLCRVILPPEGPEPGSSAWSTGTFSELSMELGHGIRC